MSVASIASRIAQRVKAHYAEALLLSWLLLPNLAQWLTTGTHLSWLLASALVSLSFFSLPAIIVRTRRALFLANLPWAFFSGFLATFIILYHSPISSGMMQSLLLTNWRESSEQLNRYALPAFISLATFFAYFLLARRLSEAPLKYRKTLMACGLWGVIGLIYLPYASFEAYERFDITFDTQLYRQAYPVNLLETGHAAMLEHKLRKKRNIQLPAISPLVGGERKIFVLIIGESTRAHSFDEIDQRTGFLGRFPDLVYFRDTLAQSNFTDASIPMLLTGAGTLHDVPNLPRLIDWQNAVGCVTAVISNNTSYDFSRGATIRDIAGDSGITHHTRYDHDMLATVDGILATTAPRHLCLVLHMAGSHFDYSARYRNEFELYPVEGDTQQRLRATYLNSVVMVQDFIARLINRLSVHEGQTVLAFTSDHGENLMEIEGLKEHVTNRPTAYELQVPMLFWANKNYREAHREKWQQLVNNHRLPVSNRELLPTLLDAMDLPAPTFSHGGSLMRKFVPSERHFVHPDHSLRSEKTLLRDS